MSRGRQPASARAARPRATDGHTSPLSGLHRSSHTAPTRERAPLLGDAPRSSQSSKYGSRPMSCTATCSRILIVTGARSDPVTAPEGIRPMPRCRCESHDVPSARVVIAPSAAESDTAGWHVSAHHQGRPRQRTSSDRADQRVLAEGPRSPPRPRSAAQRCQVTTLVWPTLVINTRSY